MYWEGSAARPAASSVPTRCTATATRACSGTRHSCGRATSTPPGKPCAPTCHRDQHRAFRHPILGYRHRWIRPHQGADRRAFHVRWFQFSAFCPLFRSHGRTWKLRLPWGWNTGELGPNEIRVYGNAANPEPAELHNAAVEPICRTYLELRYRLMPYLYSVVREGCLSGLPIIRALWLHDPADSVARSKGDEFLFGPDILVAPVTDKGATSRRLYLPRGTWYDYWSERRVEGGHEISRPVDLATIPLHVRAGAIIPLGPIMQYTSEQVDGPLGLAVYPGTDGNSCSMRMMAFRSIIARVTGWASS